MGYKVCPECGSKLTTWVRLDFISGNDLRVGTKECEKCKLKIGIYLNPEVIQETIETK